MQAPETLAKTAHAALSACGFRPDVIGTRKEDLSAYKMIVSAGQYTLDENGFAERMYEWVKAGGTWVVGPLTDIVTPDGTKYKNAPYGHLEDFAKVFRVISVPAPHKEDAYASFAPIGERTKIRLANGEVIETAAVTYDALRADGEARVLGTYEAGGNEYLTGHAAITETQVGAGRIILLGAQPSNEAYEKLLTAIAAECGITPITEKSKNVLVSRLTGERGSVLALVETDGVQGATKIPANGTDILSGKRLFAGENLILAPYECLFIKEE
jgi:beta-galactosidase GanA